MDEMDRLFFEIAREQTQTLPSDAIWQRIQAAACRQTAHRERGLRRWAVTAAVLAGVVLGSTATALIFQANGWQLAIPQVSTQLPQNSVALDGLTILDVPQTDEVPPEHSSADSSQDSPEAQPAATPATGSCASKPQTEMDGYDLPLPSLPQTGRLAELTFQWLPQGMQLERQGVCLRGEGPGLALEAQLVLAEQLERQEQCETLDVGSVRFFGEGETQGILAVVRLTLDVYLEVYFTGWSQEQTEHFVKGIQ